MAQWISTEVRVSVAGVSSQASSRVSTAIHPSASILLLDVRVPEEDPSNTTRNGERRLEHLLRYVDLRCSLALPVGAPTSSDDNRSLRCVIAIRTATTDARPHTSEEKESALMASPSLHANVRVSPTAIPYHQYDAQTSTFRKTVAVAIAIGEASSR
ncbi:hypothetical protein ARMGADRAFT_539116 [Armillaria gallica]|uniref:Uncharacterized protein n=1 Tax=Armillaria gallica TaxID=47427 RepID=A0A2H3D611_ARMGA|nr:hypothetical protein ARMGADRAFT_539116 [Armillaria gallica]